MNTNFLHNGARPTSGEEPREYKTSDIDQSAFFETLRIPHVRIDPPSAADRHPLATVVFPWTPELLDAVAVWSSNGTTSISPRDFAYHRRELFRQVRAVSQKGAVR